MLCFLSYCMFLVFCENQIKFQQKCWCSGVADCKKVMELSRTPKTQKTSKIAVICITASVRPQNLAHIWKELHACSGGCMAEKAEKLTSL